MTLAYLLGVTTGLGPGIAGSIRINLFWHWCRHQAQEGDTVSASKEGE